jgi:hypothetical protein
MPQLRRIEIMNLSLLLLLLLPLVAATDTHGSVRPLVEDELARDALLHKKNDANGTSISNSPETNVVLQQGVVDWIRKEGGYFNPKQEFRPASLHHFGVFASQDIPKGEMLVSVPWKCILTADTDELDNDIYCDSTHYIIEEMNKGNDSFYAPYLEYLQAAPPVHFASTFSKQGKRLFKQILGNALPPKRATAWVSKYWKKECEGSLDPNHVQVAMQLISRGDDDTLTPLYDMYNHRNGDWLNTECRHKRNKDHAMYASRDIKAGEEIFLSYNQCAHCRNRKFTYGTPELYRDYGFVEQYPQRWIFHEQEIAFDLYQDEESGEVYLVWLDDDVDEEFDDLYEVSEWGIEILQGHLERLKKLYKQILRPLKSNPFQEELPQQDLDSIMAYYNALTLALELAVEASEEYDDIVERRIQIEREEPLDEDDVEIETKRPTQNKPKKKKKYFARHASAEVAPGELALLRWYDTNEVIDPYAAQIGLPAKLVPTIKAFVNELGILDLVKDFLYNDPCKPKNGRFYHLPNPFRRPNPPENQFPPPTDDSEMVWYAQRPGGEWHSDMHWFAPSDERSHEITIRMLMEGGFGEVLEAIGTHYDLDGLTIQSAGILAVTHCEEGYLHTDFKQVEGKVFNFLIPLHSPEGADAELQVVGERRKPKQPDNEKLVRVATKYKYNETYGVLVGDGTWHGTRECDHRPTGDIRAVMSVYLADLTEDNLERIAYDDTAIFPIPGEDNWLWAQRGRHWMKDACVANDLGRREFETYDDSDQCPALAAAGYCESQEKTTRRLCPKSCRIFMNDWEYLPGVERSKVIGSTDISV